MSLSLSLSLRDTRQLAHIIAQINGVNYQTSLTSPYDPESPFLRQDFVAYLTAHITDSFSPIYKDLRRIARAVYANRTVIIRCHEDAGEFADIVFAAVRTFVANFKPTPRSAGSSQHDASLSIHNYGEDLDQQSELDERRFVYITTRDGHDRKLGYIWDTEAVLTALVPDYGLIKLGRAGKSFWLLRGNGKITSRVSPANLTLGDIDETPFVKLVRKQQAAERIEKVQRLYDMDSHQWYDVPHSALDERYDNDFNMQWDTIEETFGESEQEQFSAQDTEALIALHNPDDFHTFWHKLPRSAYKDTPVKPVIKTKPDGSRWILSPEMQLRGAVKAFTRI